MIVVADATPLIALAKIEQLALLRRLFGQICIPPAVYAEIVLAAISRSLRFFNAKTQGRKGAKGTPKKTLRPCVFATWR